MRGGVRWMPVSSGDPCMRVKISAEGEQDEYVGGWYNKLATS